MSTSEQGSNPSGGRTVPQPVEQILLPWDAVNSKTSYEYLRKSKFFLESAGLVDSKVIKHRNGTNRMAVAKEREAIRDGMLDFVDKSMKDPRFARGLVLSFIDQEKKRVQQDLITAHHLRNCLKPVKLALDLNEVALPWKKIMRIVPNSPEVGEDRAYALDEIRKVCGRVSLHLQVPVLFMSSCGMRVGAFEYLNVGHVRPVLRTKGKIRVPEPEELCILDELPKDADVLCAVVRVYGGEGDDEYDTLVSREAWVKLNLYLDEREKLGELLTKRSPLIVVRSRKGRLAVGTIRNYLNRVLWKLQIRTEKRRRQDFQVDHGFRKFFDNVAKDFLEEAYVEKLIGHDTGTKAHYDRHLPIPLIEGYLRAMPSLSIEEAYRNEAVLREELEVVKVDQDKRLQSLRLENLELKEKQRGTDDRLKKLEEYLYLKDADRGR